MFLALGFALFPFFLSRRPARGPQRLVKGGITFEPGT
jgi:hypothetical protein